MNITFLDASKTDINSKQIDSQTFSYLPPIKSSVKFIPIKTTTNNVKASAKIKFLLGLYTSAFMNCIFTISLMLLASEAFASSNSPEDFCNKYDWEKVEALVEPHLDEASHTTFVMQGLSSEYNTSVAAYQAMHSQLPEEIYDILSRIVKLNCS